MNAKNEYIRNMASQLKESSAEVDLLIARSETAAADLKLKYLQNLNALRIKEFEAIDKMKELQEASNDAWETAKETADNIWDELKTSLTGTASIFRQGNCSGPII